MNFLDLTIGQLGQDYFKGPALTVGNFDLANYRTDGTDDQVQLQAAIDAAFSSDTKMVSVESSLNVNANTSYNEIFGSIQRRIAVRGRDAVLVIIRASCTINYQSGGNSGGSTFTSVFGNYGNLTGFKVICEGTDAFDGLSSIGGSALNYHSAVWLDARSQGCTSLEDCQFIVSGKRSAGPLYRVYASNTLGTSVAKNIDCIISEADRCINAALVERNGESINTRVINAKNTYFDSVVYKDGVEDSKVIIDRVVNPVGSGLAVTTDTTVTTKFNQLDIEINCEAASEHGVYLQGWNGGMRAVVTNNQKSGIILARVIQGGTDYWPTKQVINAVAKNNNQIGATWSGIQGVTKNLELIGYDTSDSQISPTQYRGVDFSDPLNDYISLVSGRAIGNVDTNNQIVVKGVNSSVSKQALGFTDVVTIANGATYTINGPEKIYILGDGSVLKFPKFSDVDSNLNPGYQIRVNGASAQVQASQENDLSYKPINTLAPSAALNVLQNQTFEFLKFPDRWATTNNSQEVSDILQNKTISTGSKLDANADENFTYWDISRQALRNANFDQENLNTNNPANNSQVAREWNVEFSNSGTLPTSIVHTTEKHTPGDLAKSFYYYRVAPNGAGSGFGANDFYEISQSIINGTRYLAGNSRQITVSFWARSNLTSKKLGLFVRQDYGSGGSPSSAEIVNGQVVTLTSAWQKFTRTFTLNTLSGKTFGTNNDDYIKIYFAYMWGSGATAIYVGNPGVAETFVGAGNIDVSQIQVNAGSVALPFNPRQQPQVIPVTVFQNSWVSNVFGAPVGYYKDFNRVYLRGVLSGGTINTPCFTLPVGYRPTNPRFYIARAGASWTTFQIATNGEVKFEGGDSSFCPVDGISFELF